MKRKEMAGKNGFLVEMASRGLYMRLLLIFMLGMGFLTGTIFPFFIIIVLGLPKEIVFRPGFVLACLAAGLLVGFLNYLLVRVLLGVVLSRLAALASQLAQGDLSN
ncbi:MAG: hypothetical protein K6U04_10625 [Armatimonadetes bacterium]|nr:hypothetical protein [Armatimonadota bacterium]